MTKRHGKRIVVPTRPIQGGLDVKFESDPYDVELHGLMTATQYQDAIDRLNDGLRPSRASSIDAMLLAVGPLMVPLIPWAIRHGNQTRRRKRLLAQGVQDFHTNYPHLLMRWNRRPEGSVLTIERRPNEMGLDSEYHPGDGGQEVEVNERGEMLAQATLLNSDDVVVAPVTIIPPTTPTQQTQPPQQATSSVLRTTFQPRQSTNVPQTSQSGLV